MSRCHCHTIHADKHHFGWCNGFAPAVTVAPGDIIEFETLDSSGGQIDATTVATDIPEMDYSRFCPLSGPIFIDGAEPGDAVQVDVIDLSPTNVGWTAILPPYGLLIDEINQPALHHWKLEVGPLGSAAFGANALVPLKPFIGTIGLALAAPGVHSTIPPRRVGGNMDIRDLGVGTELLLPVEVEGGLLSLGDTHLAQGDGEVCGTAIESPLRVTARVTLHKALNLPFPRLRTASPVTRHLDGKGYEITTGIGPDIMENAKIAVRQMVDLLMKTRGLSETEAYMLCSVCADLRISDIVDMPNWVVSFYFPRIVFE